MDLDTMAHHQCGAALLLTMLSLPAWAGVCRVATNGTIFNDGSNWGTPATLVQALSVPGTCTEIWVKKGLYKPTTSSDTTISFVIADGVGVYGGFAGSETARDQRDPSANLTVLSGDIDNNDMTDANGVDVDPTRIVGNNSHHVVNVFQFTNAGAVFDGFTVTGGSTDVDNGGGLYCSCTATLSHLVFSGNIALPGGGGAIFIDNTTSPTLSHIVFHANRADSGGALRSKSSGGKTNLITLNDVTFEDNQAYKGGAMYTEAYATGSATLDLTNVTFTDNFAFDGGAMYAYASNGAINATLRNVTFFLNAAAGSGGAIYSTSSGAGGVALTNVTFNANQASAYGGAIYSNQAAASALTLRNTILWGDVAPLGQGSEIAYMSGSAAAVIDHSIVKGSGGSGGGWNTNLGTDGGGNLEADPRLAAPAYNRGDTWTMVPGPGSPGIDAGNGTGCPSSDQRGILRPQGAACDIGAVETFVVDLIGHKGGEACWSKAVTKSSFLGLVGSNVEGNTACIPPFVFNFFNGSTFVTYNVCYTAACPGGAVGCPITTHTGVFSDGGDFGAGQFSATGSAENFTMAGVSGYGTCNYSASGITTSYASDYVFTDDGNHGDYAALLNQFTATPTAVGLSGAGSDPNCGLSAIYFYPYFYAFATVGMSAGLQQKLQNPTVGRSVCPAP
jgi:predicted outer membrane repeat protein